MSKFFKGDVTNGVVEFNLLDPAVGAGGTTATIVTKNTGANVVEKITGDIPASQYGSGSNGGYTAKGLVIGTSCTTIGSQAFFYCTALTGDLVIPDSVTSIGGNAFFYCTSLTSLTIGNSVTTIGSSAFSDCGFTGTLTIPNSVTSIGSYAFSSCTGFTGTLTIPNSVTSIGNGAFYYCTGLTSLTIGNSVTTIESYAFGGCVSLTTAYLATPFANIPTGGFGSGAFYYSGLTTVYAKDAVANGWTLGAGQTVGGKTGVTVIDWTNYPNIP